MNADHPTDGVAGFFTDLGEFGVTAEITGIVAYYSITAPGGAYAGEEVQTAVAVSELLAWPALPPHWVHFPSDIKIPLAHPDQSGTLPGWTRHSRQIDRWDTVTEPGRTWLAHVRSVVAGAV